LKEKRKHTCYIRDCENATLNVKGKPLSITVDGCWYTKIVVETTPIINIANCFSIVVVCNGVVSNININKTHKCVVKCLDKESSANTEITSSASTKLTIEDSENSSEVPISLKAKLQRGKLTVL